MAFKWDVAPRIFLVTGMALVVAAGVLLLSAPTAAIYPLALGATFLLAALVMAFEAPKRP